MALGALDFCDLVTNVSVSLEAVEDSLAILFVNRFMEGNGDVNPSSKICVATESLDLLTTPNRGGITRQFETSGVPPRSL